MTKSRDELTRRYFGALNRGDVDEALSALTSDCVLDRRNSNAPWKGISRGLQEARLVYQDFFANARETLEGFRWELERLRAVGSELVAVGTRIGGRGVSSGLEVDARGGWMLRFEGELVAEAVLYQSFEEALLACRRRALAEARLYFVCDALPHGGDPSELLGAAVRGGADVIQLREKAPRCAEEIVAFAEPFARAASEQGALFFVNDEPGLVESCGADGVHVGQDDAPVAEARAQAGPAALVGLSTHSPEQFDAALAAAGGARPDQVSAGPVWATPTKEGRPATGLGLIDHAAARGSDMPWFAIGGIDASNVESVVAAGARRIVVVRAIRDADDPEAAARRLRAALGAER